MKNKLNFKDLNPKNAIGIAIIVLVVVVAVYLLWNKVSDAISSKRDKSEAKKREKKLIEKYGTGTVSNYNALCQQLYNATCANIWGADVDAVIRVMNQLGNQADYYLLGEAWTVFWKGQNWWERNWDSHLIGDFSTLEGMLTAELSSKKLAKVRAALELKNISPTF